MVHADTWKNVHIAQQGRGGQGLDQARWWCCTCTQPCHWDLLLRCSREAAADLSPGAPYGNTSSKRTPVLCQIKGPWIQHLDSESGQKWGKRKYKISTYDTSFSVALCLQWFLVVFWESRGFSINRLSSRYFSFYWAQSSGIHNTF